LLNSNQEQAESAIVISWNPMAFQWIISIVGNRDGGLYLKIDVMLTNN
jgi:hypothetical protein